MKIFSWVEGSFFLSIVTFLVADNADARSRISLVLLSQKKKRSTRSLGNT